MYSEIILIPPCTSYGDILSIIGILLFLLKYYQKVYLFIINENEATDKIFQFYNHFFINFKDFNQRIFIIDKIKKRKEIHICNTHAGSWKHEENNYLFKKLIKKENYFCDFNPLYNKLNIEEKYLNKPNLSLPLNNIEINHIIYYKLVGLNNNVRMEYFNYIRNKNKESEIKKLAFDKYNIKENEKFIVINSSGDERLINLVKNKKYIDLHYLCDFIGFTLTLLEEAEEIHLIEGSNTNFIYHCQYKKIINIDNDINLHINLRNRNWKHFNLDYAYKMYENPKLDNWNFIF